ncbi:four helix bundle protein [Oceanisphaera arctica]|uniref:bAvd-like domain-containing protein n=1 Tax=Oceanisphaera arctica TaxID=641510 RepID=A0A2P5THX6_9GAMM|nr:four helix bundle protein [Oceanisphaera arctica]PPL14067.1 hypothetical protein UN63_16730 [Oceanisphaera arctica]GHA05510.1 hypothetical protein GCM10007082_03070 [Oceanisphaera arctica]
MGLHNEARLDGRMLRLIKQLNQYLGHFPRFERYGLSQQIRTAAYDTYALIVAAQKPYSRKTTLGQLDVRHEQLRMLVRLAGELGYFGWRDERQDGGPQERALRRLHTIELMIDEVGMLIGGWIRSYRDKEGAKRQ